MFGGLIVAKNSDIWDTKLKIITRPILKFRCLLRLLFNYGEVGKEDTSSVRGNKDEDVPKCVEVGEVEGMPGRAE
jgi:hypothetical protein